MFHKITSVSPLPNYKLSVHFWNGATKLYDVNPLFKKWPAFNALKTETGDWNGVYVAEGGYGIIWNDDLDLSSEELWENGKEVKTPFDNIISFTDASEIWGLNESTLRKAVAYGRFVNGVDVCKYGKQWLISLEAMQREYGPKS